MVIFGHAVFAVNLGPEDKSSCIVNGLLGMLHVESAKKGVVYAFLLAAIRYLQHALVVKETEDWPQMHTFIFTRKIYGLKRDTSYSIRRHRFWLVPGSNWLESRLGHRLPQLRNVS
jgi:hypothetical protein